MTWQQYCLEKYEADSEPEWEDNVGYIFERLINHKQEQRLCEVTSIIFVVFLSQDIEILGWCPVGSVLPHGEKVPL